MQALNKIAHNSILISSSCFMKLQDGILGVILLILGNELLIVWIEIFDRLVLVFILFY